MPELPEVEIAARNLRRWLAGKRITRADFPPTRILRKVKSVSLSGKKVKPISLSRLVVGRTVEEVARKGKWLRLGLSGGAALYSHLGMTGKWVERPRASGPERYERARLDAGRASVRYLDPRLFGRLIASPDGAPPPEWLALGDDPLTDGVDEKRLAERLARTGRSIKEALLDQRLLPGVGNIQAAEALWRAKIDPRTPARDLDGKRVRALARAVEKSIRDTIAREDSPEITYVEEPGADNLFDVYGKHGRPCPRCRTKLVRLVQAGRSTVYCPRCQRAA
ncbi:MAG TPA: DNA-formamidopyrimidine glycosylase family protein [Polyangia bacterium]|nr:DNA-formamidopyrimidine glycosylase family protein [Polyangia bacterium]